MHCIYGTAPCELLTVSMQLLNRACRLVWRLCVASMLQVAPLSSLEDFNVDDFHVSTFVGALYM
jgi:hypothetical protein